MVGWISTGMPRPLSFDLDDIVGFEGDDDLVAAAGHGLVDAVVDDLVDEVLEAALVSAADVHAGAAPHGFTPAEDLDILGGIVAVDSGQSSGLQTCFAGQLLVSGRRKD